MLNPLVCGSPDNIVVEGVDNDVLGATTYVGESGDSTPFGSRFWRRMLRIRPHRAPNHVYTQPNGNDEVIDANVQRGVNG